MRYKENTLQKVEQAMNLTNKLQVALNRGMQQEADNILQTLKEQLTSIREIVSVEEDDFEQQFKPR